MYEISHALMAGGVIGFLIHFSGVGAGVLLVPFLSYFFSLPVSVAVGTAAAYATFTKVIAGVEHIRTGHVNFVLFRELVVSAIPGLLFSAVYINYILQAHPEKQAEINYLIQVAVIAVIILSLFFTATKPEPPPEGFHVSRFLRYASGFSIGSIIGATGIGGGVLLLPALFALGGDTPKRIVGTSVLIALCLSGITAIIYAGGEQFDFQLALWMSLGSVIGVPISSVCIRHVSNRFVYNSVLMLICCSMLLMLVQLFDGVSST